MKSLEGEEGLIFFQGFLSNKKKASSLKDRDEFFEYARRILLPYYEEARLHFNKERENGILNDGNFIDYLVPSKLRWICKKYRDSELL